MKINYFWDNLKYYSGNTVLVNTENNVSYTYGELDSFTRKIASNLTLPQKGLIFLFTKNNYETVAAYLAALKSGNAVLLLDEKLNMEFRLNLIKIYNPDFIISSDKIKLNNFTLQSEFSSLHLYKNNSSNPGRIYPDLALLLSTSGTTGSPKLVRLSYENIGSNAEAIAEYLHLDSSERPVSSLPFSYSYGLSVLNSHLQAGASIVFTNKTFVLRDFWKTFNNYECTSFAGVPYTYQLLKKTNFHKIDLPSLKYLTQAGGALDRNTLDYFLEYAENKNILFYTMYGQTEASPRISYVPPEKLREKIGSIGKPIPGGSILLYKNNKLINEQFVDGEITYRGKNVMMGYAESRKDLEKGDEMNGELRTGDIAYRDDDGYYFITGRLKRFIKIFGLRLNLDDIEKEIESRFGRTIACTGDDNIMSVFIEGKIDIQGENELKEHIVKTYDLNMKTIRVIFIDKMLFTSNGKKNYKKLREAVS